MFMGSGLSGGSESMVVADLGIRRNRPEKDEQHQCRPLLGDEHVTDPREQENNWRDGSAPGISERQKD